MLGAYQFLCENAALLWADMLDHGVHFVVPPEIPLGLDAPDLAARLAAVEAERIRTAQTYFVTPDAVEGLMKGVADQLYRDGRAYMLEPGLMPDATTGFLLWGSSVGDGSADSPITAMHWEKRDNYVWTAWWTDTSDTVARRLAAGTMTADQGDVAKAANGPLTYEREHLLSYGTSPEGIGDDDDLRLMILTRITITTWRLLAALPTARVNLPADERGLFAAAGLPTDPVRILERQ